MVLQVPRQSRPARAMAELLNFQQVPIAGGSAKA
jgi:hypothetical protein